MAASNDKRSRRGSPTAPAAEIPGIVTPPVAATAETTSTLPGLPGSPPLPRGPRKTAKPRVAAPAVAAEQAPAVAEAAAEQVGETRETVQEAVADTTETVAETAETLGAETAAATQDLTATVADTATVAIEKTADIADRAGDAVETSIAAAAEAAVETQDAAHAAYAPQETTIMNDTIQNTTEKSQAFIADANERAKGAMEKGTKFFQEMTEFGKGNVEAVVESSKIAARGLETMGQDTAAYLKSSFEEASQALRTLSTIKSPTELLKFQSDYVRSAFDALVAQTSRGTEASLKLAGEVAQPISNRVAVAAEKIKVSA